MANEELLIDANALMEAFRSYMVDHYDSERCVSEENCKTCENPCLWRKIVRAAPTVDAVKVVHGRWVVSGCGFDACSVCRKVYKDGYFTIGGVKPRPQFNYCPNCGAKMDGGNEDV